ncbi:serine hydrolase domain-containing protein [Clavibacter tessellarius]|uniref:Penicillin-binding protein n=1 Tax=Clavibacter tessellarius TaxID=31965 RepID=A0A154V3H5_9MICO|nr:serine hydrolase domain-containing protein [Clavibacter michiganensis]KZC95920.1 penicillin-binding protein [Clavibacter michiganensis subsp. tessellarius]
MTEILEYVRTWLDHRVWQARVPGAQVAIARHGEVVLSEAFGVADPTTDAPLTPAHLFRVASHSKTFTATAILQLAEQGALRLDDRLGQHVPELVDAGSELADVTLAALLEHGAGVLRDGFDGDHWQHSAPFPDRAHLLAIATTPGVAKVAPDTAFNYSNIGYSLLGLVVEAASGLSFADYLATRIAAPLGLRDTTAEYDPARADEYAAASTSLRTSRERAVLPHVDTRAMAAATGVTSTASELVSFFSALVLSDDERLLTAASKRVQQRPRYASSADPAGTRRYGYGLIIERVGSGDSEATVIGHSGGYPGHITRTAVDPASGWAVTVLTNAIDGPAAALSTGILELLLADSAATDAERAAVDAPFTGRFANVWGMQDFQVVGDRFLRIDPTAEHPLESVDVLERTGDSSARIVEGDGFGSVGEEITVERAADGSVDRIRGGGGMTLEPLVREWVPRSRG